MEATAHLRHIRISPRKVSIVCDLIRGKNVGMAASILKQTPKAGAAILEKVLASAVANAENNHELSADDLVVSKVFVTPGPILKRIRPRAQGRAFRIYKRSSHITVTVAEKGA
jgi:large subunit ribosomal protein L22